MTIIVFLIDTSASMNQRAYLGGRPRLLDVAKNAVETFVKVRQRCPESRGDRYMLLTFEDPPANVKAAWKENLATFINELKNLQCLGLTTMGAALKHAFDVLNINRMQTGIDTYGQGRCPFYLEPSVIVVITDGGKLSTTGGVQEDFNLPMNCPIPGSELTREPFRWDQRLFSLVLRLSGTPAVERDSGLVPSDSSPIDAMCEVTGGRSYCITSHRMLMQCIDSLVQKVQSGVVINFEKIGPDPPPLDGTRDAGDQDDPHDDKEQESEMDKNGRWNGGPYGLGPGAPGAAGAAGGAAGGSAAAPQAWHSCRRLIYVPRTVAQKGFAVGFWPIPESFRPDPNAPTLPPRTAHPAVKFTCASHEPMVIDNLPFDKYELEPSPLTQYILARKQPTTCWQVFIQNNGNKSSEVSHPFGYLKASTNLTCVNLFVLPYNYPVLLPLLDDLFKVHRCKPNNEWKLNFQNYIDRMPSYYISPLRRALTKMGVSAQLLASLVPEPPESQLSFSVLNYLKRLKNQAKLEFEKLCEVVNKNSSNNAVKVAETVRVVQRSALRKDLTTHPCLQDKFIALRDQLNEFGGFVVGLSRSRHKAHAHTYRNPFDIQRRDLLDQVVRMRANFLQPSLAHTKLVDDDSLHSMPVAQMGNYQEYLKRMCPQLREIESTPMRQHMFGNPFKIDKRMMVDEADMDPLGTGKQSAALSGAGGKRGADTGNALRAAPPPKRKAGPLPQHVQARRPSTPAPPSPPASPAPRRALTPLSPLPSAIPLVIESAAGRPPEEQVDSVAAPPPSPTPPPAPPPPHAPAAQTAPPNLPPVIKPTLNGDAYTTMGSKLPRSPSPPPESPQSHPSPHPLQHAHPPHPAPHPQHHSPHPATHNSLAHAPFSPSAPPTPPAHVQDSQELQISAILQGIAAAAAENNHSHRGKKRRRSKQKETEARAEAAMATAAEAEVAAPAVSRKEITELRRHNLNVRAQLYTAIRRPGRDFSNLFEQLKQLKGGVDTKREVVQEVIAESLRFKRKALAKLLQEFSSGLERNGNSSSHKKEMNSLATALYSTAAVTAMPNHHS